MVNTLKSQQGKGPTELGIDAREWAARQKMIRDILPELEAISARLKKDGAYLTVENLLKMAFGDAAEKTLKNFGGTALGKVQDELDKLGFKNAIRVLLEQGPKGLLNANNVIDLILNGDIDRMMKAKGIDPNLKDDLKQAFLDELKKNKNALKNYQKVLEQTAAKIQKGRPKTPTVTMPEVKPPRCF